MMEPLLAATVEWQTRPAALLQILAGIVVLLAGRRLFWLFIGAAGFFAGVLLADTYLGVDSEVLRWIAGLSVGFLAALAAVFLQRMAVALGGALVSGYAVYWYLGLTWQPFETWHWLLVAAAVVIGFLVAQVVFDFGLIFLSSLGGATLILENLDADPQVSRWLFLVLVVLGAATQAASLPQRKR